MVSISLDVGLRVFQPLAAHAQHHETDAALGQVRLDGQQLAGAAR
jgi:hypothetical protein